MESESTENEWELSKENVQPLRKGRKVLSLNESLLQNSDRMNRIREEKQLFESELRTYTGDDPLDIWYRYIKWTEETFPKGGKDSNFTTILQQCIKQFKDELCYRNDERYIYAWMRMADVCNEPLDIYNFMYDQNIGCELSCLFDSWASILEQLGDTKKADAIYLEGLKRNARPIDLLKSKHEEFQKRVARGILRGQNEGQSIPDESAGQRQVLSRLKMHGSKHQAPVSRVGDSIRGSAGSLGGARPKSIQQVPSKGIQIYSDENKEPSGIQPQTGEWTTIPRRDVTNKENEKKAGIWKTQKIKKPSVSVPISEVNSGQLPKFTVHVDEDTSGPALRTPAKMPELDSQILSARKAEKSTVTSYLKNMSVPGDQNKNEKPMYCKDKIYCGAEEYSFEEIRAVRWAKKQEKLQEEAEIKEHQIKLEMEKQRLLEETEKIRQQRLQIQQEEQAMLEEANKKRQLHLEKMERDRLVEQQRQQEIIEASIQKRLQEQANIAQALPNRSVKQLFDDGGHGNTENISPNMMSQIRAHSRNQTQNLSVNQSHNSSRSTPHSQPINTSLPRSEDSSDRISIGAPSPTVHMKEAIDIVLNMFNSSLEMNKQKADEDVPMEEPGFQEFKQDVIKPAPFSIFCDGDRDKQQIKQSAPAQFSVFCEDAQNKPQIQPAAPAPFSIFVDDESSQAQTVKQKSGQMGYRTESVDREDAAMMEESSRSTATRALFDDDNIESHARDDITLAPIGSHMSFAASAKFASTPHQPNLSGRGTCSPSLDTSDVEMPEEIKTKTPEGKGQDKLDQSASNTSNTSSSFRNNLSPIMEGSNEDSGAHSKSSNQHTTLEHSTLPPAQLAQFHSEDTMSLLQAFDENNQSEHVVDTTTYIPPDMDEKTEVLLSMSVCIVDPKDPFDSETKERFLSQLKKPLQHYDNYSVMDDLMPEVKKDSELYLGMEVYVIFNQIGEGGFAKVYLAENDNLDMMTSDFSYEESKKLAIKVESPPQKWEFYICSVLHERLAELGDPFDARPAMMKIDSGYFFKNRSCLVTEFQPYGTVLEFVNKCKVNRSAAVSEHLEPTIVYMTIELLHMIENLHKCNIIHGDIKPDNFLFLGLPQVPVSSDPIKVFGGKKRFCQLIDFGQGIDMTKYPAGTTFLAKVNTHCFQCIEMKTNRPWTYQTDLFGLAGTIHVLIFQKYMKVYQTQGKWRMTSKFPRNWNQDLWNGLFDILLNIPSCDDLPNLSLVRRDFEQYFVDNLLEKYNQQSAMCNNTLELTSKRF